MSRGVERRMRHSPVLRGQEPGGADDPRGEQYLQTEHRAAGLLQPAAVLRAIGADEWCVCSGVFSV